MNGMTRRQFLSEAGRATVATVLATGAGGGSLVRAALATPVPSYLKDYAGLYVSDPHAAALKWFSEAKFGLFMHYGLYSLLGRQEWVMYRERIPVAEYEKLTRRFRPKRFDADFITDLALAAGMKYVTLTSKHHEGFCLFNTKYTDYNAARAAGRDLCGELATQCRKKGLGCFFYYSLAADWHHPYFYSRKYNPIARPAYKHVPPEYKFKQDADFKKYLHDAVGEVHELLNNYGPIAGIWFDPLMGYYGRPDLFPMNDIYAGIRRLQPQCLISFKQGVTGTEDFAAPERSGRSLEESIRKRYGEKAARIAAHAWAINKEKHNEICDTLQPHGWGYVKADDGKHKKPRQVMKMLGRAFAQNCNLLLNTGPLPDGSIHPEDVATLREVGRRIKADGWPRA